MRKIHVFLHEIKIGNVAPMGGFWFVREFLRIGNGIASINCNGFGSRLCFSKIFDTEWPSEKVTVGRTDAARQWLRVRYRMDQWVGTRLIWLLFQAKSAHCRDFTNFLSHTKKCCFYAFSLHKQKTIKKDKKRAFFGFSPLVLCILRIFFFF